MTSGNEKATPAQKPIVGKPAVVVGLAGWGALTWLTWTSPTSIDQRAAVTALPVLVALSALAAEDFLDELLLVACSAIAAIGIAFSLGPAAGTWLTGQHTPTSAPWAIWISIAALTIPVLVRIRRSLSEGRSTATITAEQSTW
ncbi:hypothetical protein [Nocardia transvalensis]|uniref:hypothetical protein n=1 Tax=Nocardia transvalensis TaxID=37333 RepID=UPI001894F699|nr:hypothetical protein [Nocardia transvalensis]MBF6333619.1 hypothetical protein [Nocardia transvalensis]